MKKKLLKSLFLGSVALMLASCANNGVTKESATAAIGTTTIIEKGDERHDIYLLATAAGYTGTYQEWLESIKGASITLQIADGFIQMKYSDKNEWINLISINDLRGEDGIGISKVEISSNGDLIISYSDGTIGNAGKVNGSQSFETYTVTFDSNGGSDVEAQVISWSAGPNLPKEPTKEGYTFAGWYYGDREWDFLTYYYPYDITLTAKWEAKNYNCTLKLNDGENEGSNELSFTYSKSFNLPTPIRHGYTFLGWYDKNDKEVENGLWTYTTDQEFTAKWERNPEVTVTFDANGGTLEGTEATVVIGSYFEAPTPTKDDVKFLGWYDENGILYKDGYFNYNTNVKFTAKWESKYAAIEDKTITVWVSDKEGLIDFTYHKIDEYLKSLGLEDFELDVFSSSNGDPFAYMYYGYDEPLDLYMMGQDYLPQAIEFGVVSKLPDAFAEGVKNDHLAPLVDASTYKDDIYAYPMGNLNGFFMYYDKSLFADVDMNSLEAIIARCEETNTNFSFDNYGWFMSSFFFGTGCKSEFVGADDLYSYNDHFIDYTDTFNSDLGYVAAKEIYDLLSSDSFNSSCSCADFASPIPSSVVFTGLWGRDEALSYLGDNCAVAKLPCFVGCDGNTYQLKCFCSTDLLCVKPNEDSLKESLLHEIAAYLSSEEVQIEKYEEFGIVPSNISAMDNEIIKDDMFISALMEQDQYAIPQKPVAPSWWETIDELLDGIKYSNGSEEDLRSHLSIYENEMEKTLYSGSCLLVGSWQGWNNKSLDSIMEKNGSRWSITFEISQDDPCKCGRIVKFGTWNTAGHMGMVLEDSLQYLDIEEGLSTNNPDMNIIFKDGGTYTLIYDESTDEIAITKVI